MSDDSTEAPPRLSEDDAREFLRLLDAVEADMSVGFEAAAARTFGDNDAVSESGATILEEWDDDVGALYTTVSRQKLRRFVERTYLPKEDDEE